LANAAGSEACFIGHNLTCGAMIFGVERALAPDAVA